MLPYVILHNEVSADGRIDWFTPDIARFYSLAARWKEDATLAGSDTILNSGGEIPPDDTSQGTVAPPDPGDQRPLLVIPDSRGRVRQWGFLMEQPFWRRAVVLCSRSTPPEYLDYVERKGVDVILAGEDRVDLKSALEVLRERHGVKVIRVDSGGTLNGVLLRAGLVQEVSLLISPNLVGGASPKSFFRAPDLMTADGLVPLRLLAFEALEGGVVWLRYRVL